MQIQRTTQVVLEQLKTVIQNLSVEDYRAELPVLSGSTVGQHVRHILEFYSCLQLGYSNSIVNYDNRPRNGLLETEPSISVALIENLLESVLQMDIGKKISMAFSYDLEGEENLLIETNISRELVYNIEHAIHHMALIKIGVKSILPNFNFPDNFGVASSTVRHHQHVHRDLSAS